ncbi:MAG: trypsin-like serine protease [Myxococcales bacterium]|nr:trypsin-like serine protease [Myxococcales bacterium]
MHKAAAAVLVIIALPCVAACGGETPSAPLHRRAQPLVNGSADPGHPAVGQLLSPAGSCTATLVGTRTVITAAHCIDSGPMRFEAGGASYAVVNKLVHPSYQPAGGFLLVPIADVALVTLDKQPPITPISLHSGAPIKGKLVTLVGFGRTSELANDGGVKRAATRAISAVHSKDFSFKGVSGAAPNICFGDSGGPTLENVGGVEMQIGIHSFLLVLYSFQPACKTEGGDMRIDKHLSWIRQAAGGDLFVDGVGPALPPPPAPDAGAKMTPDAGAASDAGAADALAANDTLAPAAPDGGATKPDADPPAPDAKPTAYTPDAGGAVPPPTTTPPQYDSPAPPRPRDSFGLAGCAMTPARVARDRSLPLSLALALLLLVGVRRRRRG